MVLISVGNIRNKTRNKKLCNKKKKPFILKIMKILYFIVHFICKITYIYYAILYICILCGFRSRNLSYFKAPRTKS